MAPKRFQDAPGSTQDTPKNPPRPPKRLQERPRMPQEPPNTPPSRSTTRILEVLGRFGESLPVFELCLLAENVKSSLNPSLNPKFQS